MDWKLHSIISFVFYTSLVTLLNFDVNLSFSSFLLLIISSMLPDLDHPKSMVRRVVFSLVFYVSIIFVVFSLKASAMVKVYVIFALLIITYTAYLKLPLSHRGRKSLHRWRYPIISFVATFLIFLSLDISPELSLFVLIGYSSHLIADKIRSW